MTASTPPPTGLSRRVKLAYGIGDLGPAIVATIRGFFLNAFLIEIAGLRPATAALIFLVVQIWDAFNDPIIGALTDRTRTRWGRRRPWLLFGSVPFGLAFFLLWLVPELSETGKFWYYLVVSILLDTGFTAVNVPYAALTPELAPGYDERTTLNSYRFSFSILGGTAALIVHTIIVAPGAETNLLSRYALSAGIMAAVIIISNLITFLNVSETEMSHETDEPSMGFLKGMRVAFQNRAFVYVTIIYLLSWLAIQFVQNNILLYVKYWTRAEEQLQPLLLILQIGTFVFLLIWSAISKRLGKKGVYYAGVVVWIGASVLLYFAPQGQVAPLYGVAILAAVGVAVCYLVPWSMLPDVVDLDELETGERREGLFYGFFVLLQKLGLSLGLAFSNLILSQAGYVKPEYEGGSLAATQPEPVLQALRGFVSLAPIVILLLGMLAVYLYPITRARHAEIQAALAARAEA